MSATKNHKLSEGGREMSQIKGLTHGAHNVFIGSLMVIGLLSLGSASAFSQDRSKPETIEATARGTEADAGREFPVTLTIYEYSQPSDKQILTEAFQNGKNQGLFNALSKMKA